MTRTGPNDASGVVWAIGEFFSIYFVFLILTIVLIVYYATERAAKTRTGPNDTKHVVWVIGEFISSFIFLVFILFLFFTLLMTIYV